jgi:hypothetical protein
MDVTIYLPDEIGERAKEEGINLSGMLRAALITELDRRGKMQNAIDAPDTYEVRLINRDGGEYTGRITGKLIDREGDWEVYLTNDERVIVYNQFKCEHEAFTIAEARDRLNAERFPDALRVLGVAPTVDL